MIFDIKGRKLICLSAFLCACGCSQSVDSEAEAIQIAERYLEPRYGRDPDPDIPVAYEQGNTWVVKYTIPPGYIGGAPTIVIDKQTGDVIKEYGDQ